MDKLTIYQKLVKGAPLGATHVHIKQETVWRLADNDAFIDRFNENTQLWDRSNTAGILSQLLPILEPLQTVFYKNGEFQFVGFGHTDIRTVVLKHSESGLLAYRETHDITTEDIATIRQKREIKSVANQLFEQIDNTNSPKEVVNQIAKLLVTGEANVTSMRNDNV